MSSIDAVRFDNRKDEDEIRDPFLNFVIDRVTHTKPPRINYAPNRKTVFVDKLTNSALDGPGTGNYFSDFTEESDRYWNHEKTTNYGVKFTRDARFQGGRSIYDKIRNGEDRYNSKQTWEQNYDRSDFRYQKPHHGKVIINSNWNKHNIPTSLKSISPSKTNRTWENGRSYGGGASPSPSYIGGTGSQSWVPKLVCGEVRPHSMFASTSTRNLSFQVPLTQPPSNLEQQHNLQNSNSNESNDNINQRNGGLKFSRTPLVEGNISAKNAATEIQYAAEEAAMRTYADSKRILLEHLKATHKQGNKKENELMVAPSEGFCDSVNSNASSLPLVYCSPQARNIVSQLPAPSTSMAGGGGMMSPQSIHKNSPPSKTPTISQKLNVSSSSTTPSSSSMSQVQISKNTSTTPDIMNFPINSSTVRQQNNNRSPDITPEVNHYSLLSKDIINVTVATNGGRRTPFVLTPVMGKHVKNRTSSSSSFSQNTSANSTPAMTAKGRKRSPSTPPPPAPTVEEEFFDMTHVNANTYLYDDEMFQNIHKHRSSSPKNNVRRSHDQQNSDCLNGQNNINNKNNKNLGGHAGSGGGGGISGGGNINDDNNSFGGHSNNSSNHSSVSNLRKERMTATQTPPPQITPNKKKEILLGFIQPTNRSTAKSVSLQSSPANLQTKHHNDKKHQARTAVGLQSSQVTEVTSASSDVKLQNSEMNSHETSGNIKDNNSIATSHSGGGGGENGSLRSGVNSVGISGVRVTDASNGDVQIDTNEALMGNDGSTETVSVSESFPAQNSISPGLSPRWFGSDDGSHQSSEKGLRANTPLSKVKHHDAYNQESSEDQKQQHKINTGHRLEKNQDNNTHLNNNTFQIPARVKGCMIDKAGNVILPRHPNSSTAVGPLHLDQYQDQEQLDELGQLELELDVQLQLQSSNGNNNNPKFFLQTKQEEKKLQEAVFQKEKQNVKNYQDYLGQSMLNTPSGKKSFKLDYVADGSGKGLAILSSQSISKLIESKQKQRQHQHQQPRRWTHENDKEMKQEIKKSIVSNHSNNLVVSKRLSISSSSPAMITHHNETISSIIDNTDYDSIGSSSNHITHHFTSQEEKEKDEIKDINVNDDKQIQENHQHINDIELESSRVIPNCPPSTPEVSTQLCLTASSQTRPNSIEFNHHQKQQQQKRQNSSTYHRQHRSASSLYGNASHENVKISRFGKNRKNDNERYQTLPALSQNDHNESSKDHEIEPPKLWQPVSGPVVRPTRASELRTSTNAPNKIRGLESSQNKEFGGICGSKNILV